MNMSARLGNAANPFRCGTVALLLCSLCTSVAHAQWAGASTQGNTGGLVIPYARVLPQGAMALSYGNYQEPQLGEHAVQQNFSLGLGLLPGLELFGRFANYTNDPAPGSIIVSGVRDLSANVKWVLPTPWTKWPSVAIGANDVAGGAVHFKSDYVVASQQVGPMDVSAGYAHGKSSSGEATFDGAFGGVAWRVGDTGLSLLAEHDGQQRHAGARWASAPLASLGGAQVVGSVQRSFGAVTPSGVDANATNLGLTLLLPLGGVESRAAAFVPGKDVALPEVDDKPAPGGMQPTDEDRLAALQKALVAVGLERVRVGQGQDVLGRLVVVEFENHRYAHNEVDALGLVFGLSAEMAPKGVQRVQAVALKEALPVFVASVGVDDYRAFLRGGPATAVRNSLVLDRAPQRSSANTHWLDAQPSAASLVRLEIKPELAYAMGTEVGVFDYSLAANVQGLVPLWRGARLYSSFVTPLDHSSNVEPGNVYDILLHRQGLKSLALQQSAWVGTQMVASVAAGRFYYDALGVQGEAALFMPGSDDLLRVRGAVYDRTPGGLFGGAKSLAGSYRHMLSPRMSLEAGAQSYGDGTVGPSVEWTQWFGDVSVQIYYRRGDAYQFAGLQLSFPLTPRQGMQPGVVSVAGPMQQAQGLRTMITTADQPANLVLPGAVRNLQLDTSQDVDLLNAGRMSQRYVQSQVLRMRQAFYLFAREQLP